MKANELKKGMVITIDNQNILIKQVQVQSPSSRSGNTLYKARGYNLVNRSKFERSFKGDESLTVSDFNRKDVQFLFRDMDGCTFMDKKTYDQYVLSDDTIADELRYITEGVEGLQALMIDDAVLGIELPTTVALKVVECAPGIKGGSASARTKPATLETGLVVQVPEYLEPDETIKVNTESGEYISRA